ncbi:hypothetical protein [Parasynechococcus sp.]|uniref:hypothetical protein n=1 Tax=Parasynechococcus sp. TaxID=3101203 RepID=UPI0037048F20
MTEPSRTEITESQAKGLGALITSLLTLFLLVLGALFIQPRLSEGSQLLPDRYVLTADEVAALPQGTLPVVLDRRLGQDQNDFLFRLLKLVLERSGTPFALGFSAAVQPQDEAIASLAEGQKAGRRNPLQLSVGVYGAGPELNRRLRAVPIPGWVESSGCGQDGPIRHPWPNCKRSAAFRTSTTHRFAARTGLERC